MALIDNSTIQSAATSTIFRSPAAVSAAIRKRLLEKDTTLDLSPTSPLRKIVDAIAAAISDTTMDAHINTISYEIDKKSGAELDQFVQLFGFSRKSALLSTGLVTFTAAETNDTNDAEAGADYKIPRGTIVTAPGNTQRGDLNFLTTAAVILSKFSSDVTVPITAQLPGSIYNLPIDSITLVSTGVEGISQVCSNHIATTDGCVS